MNALKVGIAGAVVLVVLVILGFVGIAAWLGYLDRVNADRHASRAKRGCDLRR